MQGLIDCQNETIATSAQHLETFVSSLRLAAYGGASQAECVGAHSEALDKRYGELERDFSKTQARLNAIEKNMSSLG